MLDISDSIYNAVAAIWGFANTPVTGVSHSESLFEVSDGPYNVASINSIIRNSKLFLNFVHLNAYSLSKRHSKMFVLCENCSIDAIAVSETKLSKRHSNRSIALPGFQIFRNDRPVQAGGVDIYVRSCYKRVRPVA